MVAIEALKNQREEFEIINNEINNGLDSDNIGLINKCLYKMAEFMNVDLEYSNTDEFCDYMDSNSVLSL